ncbi:MAG: hypothetical protein QOK14_1270 [Frankiaceae bacterium]|nr:hypothetical protein [Frankiaceae bacterium]
MNDLDDIHRAIDDEIYAHGKDLTPTDGVRRAIARRRLVHRSVVAGSAALVAAAAVTAVTVVQSNRHPSAEAVTPAGTSSSTVGVSRLPAPAVTDLASPVGPPSPGQSAASPHTDLALPTGGLGGLLAAVQWNGTSGALVVADAATGAIGHTYTTGIKDPSYDVLRYGDEAYFVATTDSKGCATGWSGINLVTGNPVPAPAVLSERPIQAAAVDARGDIVTSTGSCAIAPTVQTVRRVTLDASAKGATPSTTDGITAYMRGYPMAENAHVLAVAPSGTFVAFVRDGESGAATISVEIFGIDPGLSPPITFTLPDGCSPTALAYAATDLVAGVSCAQSDGTTVLTVLRWDSNGTLLMRKDLSTKFKEAAISDIAVQDGAIYYVVNAEGLESRLYRLTGSKTDPELAMNLFHVAAAP